MKTLTCICQEHGNPSPLIYTITLPNVHDRAQLGDDDQAAITAAVQAERVLDLGDDAGEIEVMFCFEGDLSPCLDWRD